MRSISLLPSLVSLGLMSGGLTWLEVAKVLLAQARLLVDLDVVPLKRRRAVVVVSSESAQDALGGLARAAVGRGEDADGVVLAQHGLEAAAGVLGLQPALGRQADAVVGDELVDVAVAVALGLAVADEDEQPWFAHGDSICSTGVDEEISP
jgi:hypothetical protein